MCVCASAPGVASLPLMQRSPPLELVLDTEASTHVLHLQENGRVLVMQWPGWPEQPYLEEWSVREFLRWTVSRIRRAIALEQQQLAEQQRLAFAQRQRVRSVEQQRRAEQRRLAEHAIIAQRLMQRLQN